MPSYLQFPRIDTVELKSQISRKLGRHKADKYFYIIKKLLSFKLSKLEFDKLCYNTVGKENIALHNHFIRSILANAYYAQSPPSRQATTGSSGSTGLSSGLIGDLLPSSPPKGRSVTSRDRRALQKLHGPNEKLGPDRNVQEGSKSCGLQKSRERQISLEGITVDSKALLEVASAEEGEEVEQVRNHLRIRSRSPVKPLPGIRSRSPVKPLLGIRSRSPVKPLLGIRSRSPVKPPLGIPMGVVRPPRKSLYRDSSSGFPETCLSSSELPDTKSLMKRMEQRLELEGLSLSVDCANLLNNGLEEFMKRLIKPCMELSKSRCSNGRMVGWVNGKFYHAANGEWHEANVQRSVQSYSASAQDFQVSMQLNPQLLGVDWPIQLEKIKLRSLED